MPGIRSAACALSSSDLACPVRCLCSTQVIELPIKHPELFESLGIAQPKGVLMYGPPGTGKTLLARAVAHHTDCTFIRVSGGELVQKYIGEGSRMVRELFVMAREHGARALTVVSIRRRLRIMPRPASLLACSLR